MRLALFLIFLNLGIACLASGLFFTRKSWRTDIAPFGRDSRPFQIALHPERYAGPGHLPLIRALNITGAVALFVALGIVGYDVLVGIPAWN